MGYILLAGIAMVGGVLYLMDIDAEPSHLLPFVLPILFVILYFTLFLIIGLKIRVKKKFVWRLAFILSLTCIGSFGIWLIFTILIVWHLLKREVREYYFGIEKSEKFSTP